MDTAGTNFSFVVLVIGVTSTACMTRFLKGENASAFLKSSEVFNKKVPKRLQKTSERSENDAECRALSPACCICSFIIRATEKTQTEKNVLYELSLSQLYHFKLHLSFA